MDKPYAKIKGDSDFDHKVIDRAEKLLDDKGYRTFFVPREGILEVNVYPINGEPMCLTDLRDLEKFLNGEKIERSMWTIL